MPDHDDILRLPKADINNNGDYVDSELCQFDYSTATWDAGTYCRYHQCYHFGV